LKEPAASIFKVEAAGSSKPLLCIYKNYTVLRSRRLALIPAVCYFYETDTPPTVVTLKELELLHEYQNIS
jgi:hypothetical protein